MIYSVTGILKELCPYKTIDNKKTDIDTEDETLLLSFIRLCLTKQYDYFEISYDYENDSIINYLKNDTGFEISKIKDILLGWKQSHLTLYYKIFDISFEFIYNTDTAIEIAENFNLAIKSIIKR